LADSNRSGRGQKQTRLPIRRLENELCPRFSSTKQRLTDHSGLQVHEDSSGDVLPIAGLAEEGGEGVVVAPPRLFAGHLAVGLDAVLQAVQLPAGVAHLDSGLADVDRDTLSLEEEQQILKKYSHIFK